MFSVGQYWNPKQASLKETLKEGKIEDAKILLYELHSVVHSAKVYEKQQPSYMDEIWEIPMEKVFRIRPSINDVTIAWNIWHITRIEDITSNILMANTNQVLNNEWLERLNIRVKDTGNSMSDEETIYFSNEINLEELRNYRNSVGIRTRKIIENLRKEDLKRKFTKTQLDRVLIEGGIVEHPESIWLLDFWGKKTVAGILLMPITRHQIVHLNDCSKLKSKVDKCNI
ncbi:UNVERIFIED_CONTAM: DinB family protein [Acetivibrio alkalicellulosi]